MQHTLLYISLQLFCTTSTWIFLVQVLWRKCRMCSCSLFFFHCRSCSNRWSLAFLIFSPPVQKFLCFSTNEIYLLYYLISRSRSFSGIHVSVVIKIYSRNSCQVIFNMDGEGNWQAIVIFHVLGLLPCLIIVLGVNVTFDIGLHVGTVTWLPDSRFFRFYRLPFFLSIVLRCARSARARSPL